MVVQLLQFGIPWEAIQILSEAEIHLILGVSAAFEQKKAEDEQRAMAANKR